MAPLRKEQQLWPKGHPQDPLLPRHWHGSELPPACGPASPSEGPGLFPELILGLCSADLPLSDPKHTQASALVHLSSRPNQDNYPQTPRPPGPLCPLLLSEPALSCGSLSHSPWHALPDPDTESPGAVLGENTKSLPRAAPMVPLLQ